MENGSTYSGQDLAILVPTKDRPGKIRNLFHSIVDQTILCQRVIVVDGGDSIRELVMSFSHILPVEYRPCSPPGQIRQRNMGIAQLDERTSLVALLDDDIVLFPTALEEMIGFWNACEPQTAGVSFNIVNMKPERHTWWTGLMGVSGPLPGRVLSSGRNTPIVSVSDDWPTQWVSGGATVWRQEILKDHSHAERNAKWAPTEDVMFSYPIGKEYPLYVCADAQVRHEHVYDLAGKRKFIYYGRTEALWRFKFVESHHELSRTAFLWMQLSTIAARIVAGSVSLQGRHFQFAFGQIEGVLTGLLALIRGRDLASVLEEPPVAKPPGED